VQRWLFILLAVVAGWFPPANARARTRTSQAAYDTGALLEKVVVVAGITGDSGGSSDFAHYSQSHQSHRAESSLSCGR
jgi:hypothetical protein